MNELLLAYLVVSFLITWWFFLTECTRTAVTPTDIIFSGFLALMFHLGITPILILFVVLDKVAAFINKVSGRQQ